VYTTHVNVYPILEALAYSMVSMYMCTQANKLARAGWQLKATVGLKPLHDEF